MLSIKFQVISLIKATNKYISTHQKEVVIDLLLNHKDNEKVNSQEYEEIISNNLPDYFKDDKILSLSLPVLYRIVTNYTQKNTNPEQQSEFIEFLFKCLDHFGRNGSILFEHVNIGGSGGTFLHRLLNDYSDKFDFHFINDEQLKTIYNLESNIISQIQSMKEMEASTKSEFVAMKNQQLELKTENEGIKKTIEEMSRNKDNQIQHVDVNIKQVLDELKSQITQLNEKVTQQNGLINQLNNQIEKLRNPKISCQFLSELNPIGALSILNDLVTLSAGGFPSSSQPILNITKYNDRNFINFCSKSPCGESQSYILFDFGPSKRIDLHSYLIRTDSDYYPKDWRIEGSNNNLDWTPLDKRENDDNLNGRYKQHQFVCQESHYGNENNRFRYIRYVLTNTWSNNCPYYVYLTYFELYGDVFGNYPFNG